MARRIRFRGRPIEGSPALFVPAFSVVTAGFWVTPVPVPDPSSPSAAFSATTDAREFMLG